MKCFIEFVFRILPFLSRWHLVNGVAVVEKIIGQFEKMIHELHEAIEAIENDITTTANDTEKARQAYIATKTANDAKINALITTKSRAYTVKTNVSKLIK